MFHVKQNIIPKKYSVIKICFTWNIKTSYKYIFYATSKNIKFSKSYIHCSKPLYKNRLLINLQKVKSKIVPRETK